MGEGDGELALGDLRQQLRLQCRIAGEAQRRAGQHDTCQIRLHRERPAERLHDQHRLDAAAAKPAMFLGEGEAENTQLGIARPQGPAPTLWLGRISLALLEGVGVGEQPVDAVA